MKAGSKKKGLNCQSRKHTFLARGREGKIPHPKTQGSLFFSKKGGKRRGKVGLLHGEKLLYFATKGSASSGQFTFKKEGKEPLSDSEKKAPAPTARKKEGRAST